MIAATALRPHVPYDVEVFGRRIPSERRPGFGGLRPLYPSPGIPYDPIIQKTGQRNGRGQCSRAERAMQVLDLLDWVHAPTDDVEPWSWRRSLVVMVFISLAMWGLLLLAIIAVL